MPEESVKRVLIYRLGSLGDMVVALPALHLIANVFPDAERRMLTNEPVSSKAPAAEAILGGTGLVHSYETYPWKTRSPLALLGLWWQIARWRPQVLVYVGSARGLGPARRDEKFFKLCGIRRTIGMPLTEAMQGWFFGYDVGGGRREVGEGKVEPEAERLARNLSELGDARVGEAASWNLHLSHAEEAAAEEALAGDVGAGAVAVCVGTKVQAKDWGQENWRTLLGQVASEYPGRTLVMVGAEEERASSEFAGEAWSASGGGRLVNLCGVTAPRVSAAVLARVSLFLGHDSGPMHLAAAVGTPCVAVFSGRNLPRQWFPYELNGVRHRVVQHRTECWGCMLETCIEQQRRCLTAIRVEDVMAAVREQMARGEKMSA